MAVPAYKLDKVLRVQTHVNGELRQNATTDDLIFSIPYLIMTMSEGQTLMPGDVLATGTVSLAVRSQQIGQHLRTLTSDSPPELDLVKSRPAI